MGAGRGSLVQQRSGNKERNVKSRLKNRQRRRYVTQVYGTVQTETDKMKV